MSSVVLRPTPPDATPDAGPRRNGGALVFIAAIMASLTAVFAAGICLQLDRPALVAPALILFGLPALWWGGCVWVAARAYPSLPRSHSVLNGALGFDIRCTCHGVASTVFFHPDGVAADGRLDLLVFLENYTSRQRVAEIRIGPHRGLGLDAPSLVRLHLAAGQAAVYVLPLAVAPGLAAGDHDLPVMLKVSLPAGAGLRLPGARRHLHDLWCPRFAVPFTLSSAPLKNSADLPPPVYRSLASVGEPGPRLDALQTVADLR
ncbi:MAG: hypothetical protein WC661_10420 [Opitutaceae bacterium]|jgi:hypothetical protein